MENLLAISGRAGHGKDLVADIIRWAISERVGRSLGEPPTPFETWSSTNDEASKYFKSGFKIVKYADALKDCTCRILGCTREQLEDREFKEKELTGEWSLWVVKDNDPDFSEEFLFTTEEEAKSAVLESGDLWYAYKPSIYQKPLTPRLIMQLLGTECGRQLIHPNIWVMATFAEFSSTSRWIITDCRFPNEAEAVKARDGVVIRINRDIPSVSDHPSETALDDYEGFDFVIDNNGTIEELVEKVRVIVNKLYDGE